MTLQHQETEPETSEVIRLAQQMYERDRAEQARQSSLMAAAEEVGIPSEYLTKATAQLKARQSHQLASVPVQATRQRSLAMLFIAFGLAFGLFALFFLSVRAEAPVIAPPVMIKMPAPVQPQRLMPVPSPNAAPPPPVEAAPSAGSR